MPHAEFVERITIRPLSGSAGWDAHVTDAPAVNKALSEFLREVPWRPLTRPRVQPSALGTAAATAVNWWVIAEVIAMS